MTDVFCGMNFLQILKLTFMRGFHTAWSWKLVLSCCTDRERL